MQSICFTLLKINIMSENVTKVEENALINLVSVCMTIIVCFVVAATICKIKPLEEYGWFQGAMHGLLAIPNWLMSLFSNSVLIKAPIHTSAYNVSWWIGLIIAIINCIVYMIKCIACFIILKAK